MGELMLKLFFYGAIAFVPNSSADPDHVTAYLLKVQQAHCAHLPLLHFRKSFGTFCPNPDTGKEVSCLTPDGTSVLQNRCCVLQLTGDPFCLCFLGDSELILDPSSKRVSRYVRPGPPGELPESESQVDDFSWLLRVKNFDSKASRIKSGGDINDEKLVEGRMSFGWREALACHLDQEERGGKYYIREFEFIDSWGRPVTNHRQAIAEQVMFDVRLPVRPIKLLLKSTSETTTITLGCGSGRCPNLGIGNFLIGRDCEDTMVGHHFGHFYNLTRDRGFELIPRVVANKEFPAPTMPPCGIDPLTDLSNAFPHVPKEQIAASIPQIILRLLGVSTRVICPMTYFEP